MDTPFLGMLQYYAFDFAPRGWALCNGALLPISSNTALFSLLGTFYGGNGTTNFALPDMRGRSNYGQGPGHTIGEISGSETRSLLTTNMPSHTHTVTNMKVAVSSNTADASDPTSAYPAAPDNRGSIYGSTAASGRALGTPITTVGVAGSGTPFNIIGPYLALTCCISLTGIFPSRN